MSRKEVDRLTILTKVRDKHITQLKAAKLLGITDRQVRNVLENLKMSGAEGIISKKRGKSSNRKTDAKSKAIILKLIYENYEDFGPTLSVEKLKEYHNITISRETLRKWMIENHFWVPKMKKRNIHSLRRRREYFGEMIQGDGSHHDWFETGQPCVLYVFIDDATSKITAARFEETESLDGYFETLKQHLKNYGRPAALYTDRFSVFESSLKKDNLTQFQRALTNLDINWIGANSPQAKGRVERCNRTLQDRLIKEMRIKGVRSIEEGNIFLKEYLSIFNNKFSKKPMKACDFHRPLEQGIDISRTLSKYEERTLTKDLIFQFHNIHYKIIEPQKGFCIGKKIEIRTSRNKDLRVFMGLRELEFTKLDELYEDKGKIIEIYWADRKRVTPKFDHPMKGYSYRKHLREAELKSLSRV